MMNDSLYFADTAPRQQAQDQMLQILVKAFKYDKGETDKFHEFIHDVKLMQPGFIISPIIGLTLMRSVQLNRKDIIECLISEGASINMLFRGRTMLHVAVKTQDTSMLSFLLSLDGVEMDKRDVEMITPLMESAHGKPECLKILLDAGCNMHATDLNGLTALHHTILATCSKREDVIGCLDILLAYGADINAQDSRGESCLHKAIKMNNHWFMKWLISNNCDLNLGGPKVRLGTNALLNLSIPQATPLLLAFQKANRGMVELLMACGCQFRKHHNILEYCKNFQLLYQSFQRALKNVDSLQVLSRKIIRQHMSTNIVRESECLGLPISLQRYLLCMEDLKILDCYG